MAGEFEQFQRYVGKRQEFDAAELLKKLQAQERLATMEHGPGGSADRAQLAATGRAAMQFGAGGSEDRQREILRPYYAAQASHATAEASKAPSEIAKLAAETGLIGAQAGTAGAETGRLNALTRLAKEKWYMFEKPEAEINLDAFKKLSPSDLATALARNAFLKESIYNLDKTGVQPPAAAVQSTLPTAPQTKTPWYFQGAQSGEPEEPRFSLPPFLKRRGDPELYNRYMKNFGGSF